jgi:hypothetical protein
MARGNFMQTSFLAGEWAPFSQGKMDREDYYRAANVLLNFIPTDSGAVARRSGTRFSAHAADTTSGNINLVPFVSETFDALVVELTGTTARFHQSGTILTDSTTYNVLSFSSADPSVVTVDGTHGWSNSDKVIFTGMSVPEGALLHNNQYSISSASGSVFSLNHTGPNGTGTVDGSTLALASGDTIVARRITERTMPYTAAQVSDVKFTTEEDTLYLFHPSHEINTIDRTDLTVTEQDLLDGPYLDENTTSTTLGFSATTGSITVTASSIVGINGGTGFQTTDVGRAIRVNSGTAAAPDWTWLEITARASTTSITATVKGTDLAATTAVTTWRLGVYSDTTQWPTHGVIHEGRLWLVGPSGRIDGSKTFDFFNFEPTAQDGTVADDNGVSGIFAGSGRQNPQWLEPIEIGLLVGTDGGEYLVRASSFDDPITPFTLQVRKRSAFGAASALPVSAGRNTVFIDPIGRGVIEYRTDGQTLDGNNIARDARHLTAQGLTELAYSSSPIPTIWGIRGDKRLVSTTYRDDLEGRQVAWARHSIHWTYDVAQGEDAEGRYLQDGDSRTTGLVHSIAAVPFSDPENSRYEHLWVAVTRESTVSVEFMERVFDETHFPNEAHMLDSGNVYKQEDLNGTWVETSTDPYTYDFYGLDRLNGKTVELTFRGEPVGTATVASGKATFVVANELTGTDAAYEVSSVTQVTSATSAFTGGLLRDLEDVSSADSDYEFSANEMLIGEDGDRWVPVKDLTVNNSMEWVNVDDGTVLTLTGSTVDSDLTTEGVDSDDSTITPSSTLHPQICIGIGGTAYFVVPNLVAAAGDVVVHYAYYKINSTPAIEFVGGCSYRENNPLAGTQLLYNGSTIKVVGNVSARERDAAGNIASPTSLNDYRLDNPIAVCVNAESEDRLLLLPSVSLIAASSPVNYLQDYDNFNIDLTSEVSGFQNFFLTSPWNPNSTRGFLLPGKGQDTLLLHYLPKHVLEGHAGNTSSNESTLIDGIAASDTNPRLIYERLRGVVGTSDFGVVESNTNATSSFGTDPFPDVGTDFNGATGTDLDDFTNAYVQPTDPTDGRKPWYVVFYRMYDGDAERGAARVFLWEPDTETATFLVQLKGKMFDYTTDSVSTDYDTTYEGIAFVIDTTQNELIFAGANSTGSVDFDSIVAKIGNFAPSTSAVTTVDGAHIDAIVGCPYSSRLELLRPGLNAGARNGPPTAKTRRVDTLGLFVYRSGDFKVEADTFTSMEPVVMGLDSLGRRELFTGVKLSRFQSDYNFDNMVTLEYDTPKPGTVTAIAAFLDISDR